MLLRANAVASIPFDMVDAVSGKVLDTTDAWKNYCGFMPHPEKLFWLIESAWVVNGRSYLYQSKNANGVVKILRHLTANSVKYDTRKDKFTRTVIEEGRSTDLTYPPAIDENGNPEPKESIVAFWMPDPDVEKGVPLKWPAKAALQAMGVMFNMDEASTGFFKRGMLHTYAFRVPPGTQQSDKEQFEDKVRNMLSGIKNAWRTIFINADSIEPVDLGGGLEELGNLQLTKEKREDVSIALGIPLSKLFTETARGLGGKGVVDADDRRLVADTALPDWRDIARMLNEQVLIPLGYRLEERHEKMEVFQENELDRGASLAAYVNAFMKDPEIASLMAEQLGITLSDDVQARIDEIVKEKKAKLEKRVNIVPQVSTPTSNGEIMANDPNSQSNTPDMPAEYKMADDLKLYERKALKHIGKAVPFESENIPQDTLLKIDGGLKSCKTADDVRKLFMMASNVTAPESAIIKLANSIELAVKAARESVPA
jgi:hypothetical protein